MADLPPKERDALRAELARVGGTLAEGNSEDSGTAAISVSTNTLKYLFGGLQSAQDTEQALRSTIARFGREELNEDLQEMICNLCIAIIEDPRAVVQINIESMAASTAKKLKEDTEDKNDGEDPESDLDRFAAMDLK